VAQSLSLLNRPFSVYNQVWEEGEIVVDDRARRTGGDLSVREGLDKSVGSAHEK
jgi:hypothetical protein